MKKKFSTKKVIFTFAAIVVVIILLSWGYQSYINSTPETPGTITVNQGTQTHFESLSIGLSNVDNDSAWISIHDDGGVKSVNRQVVAGDIVDIYGYRIVIESINKTFNLSLKSGSGNGNVKLTIKKQ